MSDSVIFDTHQHVKRITETGVSQDSAEAIVNTVAHILEHNLATKADISGVRKDIELLRAETKVAIAELKTDLAGRIADSQVKIITWNVGALLAFGGLGVALAKLL